MQQSKAIVTLAIGQRFIKMWQGLCKVNWQNYADKHGYDLICIDKPLDNSERAKQRSPAWQKCLILSQDFARSYERIVWIDADILINSLNAPCVVEGVPKDKVGAVKDGSLFSGLNAELMLRRSAHYNQSDLSQEPRDFYKSYGLPDTYEEVINTGVLVLSPQNHRNVLEMVYYNYEEKGRPELNAENRPLSYELLKNDQIHWLDPRFNVNWYDYLILHYPFLLSPIESPESLEQKTLENRIDNHLRWLVRNIGAKLCATTAFMNSFFLHFAGGYPDMNLVNLKATTWREIDREDSIAQSEMLGRQASILHELADELVKQEQIESAIYLLQQSIEIEKGSERIQGLPEKLSALGQLWVLQGDFERGLVYLHDAWELLQQMQSPQLEPAKELIIQVIIRQWRQSLKPQINGEAMSEEQLLQWLESLDNEIFGYAISTLHF